MKRLSFAAALLAPTAGLAACPAPVPPAAAERPVRPEPPVRPACARTNNCPDGAADEFNRKVKAFNEQATAFQASSQAYVARLNAFVVAATEYARCEVAALNAAN